jgi:RecA/RadA recombinase
MATKKKKKAERQYITDPTELAAYAESIGPELDNPPVNLDRGSFVAGALSFGSLILDLITGGGCPPGKFTVNYGPQGSGKSTTSYHLIGSALRSKVPVFFFDHEASADSKYLRSLGVRIRLDNGVKNPYFNYFQPTTGESSYRMMARLLRKLPDYTPAEDGSRPLPQALFVADSLAAMLPEAYEEDDENAQRAVVAKVHSRYMPLIKSKLGRKNVSWFATNQLRLNPSQMFGNPEYQPGGQAVGFYPDLQIRMQAVGKVFEERRRSMRFVNISTKKNKQFVPFIDVKDTLAVAFGRGFERGRDTMGYLYLTGQLKKVAGRRMLSLQTEGEHEWNNKSHFEKDLIRLFCTNQFRALCRRQLESGRAFEMFFDANDWASLYAEFDEESSEDDENLFERFTASLTEVVSRSRGRTEGDEVLDLDEEEVSPPSPPKPKRRRRKKAVAPDGEVRPKRKRRARKKTTIDDVAEELLSA